MTSSSEINLGDAVKGAWELFCKGPEIFISIAFAGTAFMVIFGALPAMGILAFVLAAALMPAAVFLAAEAAIRKDKIDFECLKPLPALLPQLLTLSLIKVVAIIVGFCFFVIPGIYLFAISIFAELLVTLERKTFLDALNASKALAHENLSAVIGMSLFVGMFALSGAMIIFLGFLLTYPLALLTLFCVYRRISLKVIG